MNDWHEFLLNRTRKCRVLVVGDVMLDRYYYGKVTRFSSDAPIPVARVVGTRLSLGGAANVADNLALLGCQTFIAGYVGNDQNCESLQELFTEHGIDWTGLVMTDNPTTTKVRIVSGHHQMFRVDFEDTSPRPDADVEKLLDYVHKKLNESLDAVVVSDNEKGVVTEFFCQALIKDSHEHGVPVIVNPYGENWIKYSGADYLTPNVARLNRVLLEPIAVGDDEAAERAARYVMRKFNVDNVLITRSGDGVTLVTEENQTTHIRTIEQEVFDSAGAGDTVLAVFGMVLAGGKNPEDGAYLANLAASIVVSKAGTYAVSRDELLKMIA